METRDPIGFTTELAVDTGITPECKEDFKSNLVGNLVEHSKPIGFATIVESIESLLHEVKEETKREVAKAVDKALSLKILTKIKKLGRLGIAADVDIVAAADVCQSCCYHCCHVLLLLHLLLLFF
ncbi:unnamed protein product [Amaranthus hypochondriacus]